MKCNIKGHYVASLIAACLLSMTILASSVSAGAAASSAKTAAIQFAEGNKDLTVDIAK